MSSRRAAGIFLLLPLLFIACLGNRHGAAAGHYQANADRIQLGESKAQVRERLTPYGYVQPVSPLSFRWQGETREMLFFRSDWRDDGVATPDEFTPFEFHDDALIAFGREDVTPPIVYVPPEPGALGREFRHTVPAGFDTTWDGLVDLAASTRFGIRTHEKASGLLTLGFARSRAEPFVDCGRWVRAYDLAEVFSGYQTRREASPYLDFLIAGRGARLDGAVNLRVRSRGRRKTEIEIFARYRVDTEKLHFVFTTREPDAVAPRRRAVGTAATRVCQPTLVLETELLAGIASIAPAP